MRIVDYGDVLLICLVFSVIFIVVIGFIIKNHYKEKYERKLKIIEELDKEIINSLTFRISFLKSLISVVTEHYKKCDIDELQTRLYILDSGIEIFDSKFNRKENTNV